MGNTVESPKVTVGAKLQAANKMCCAIYPENAFLVQVAIVLHNSAITCVIVGIIIK